MKTYWNDQVLDTRKEYKINTTHSVAGNGKPWYATSLKYNSAFGVFTFKSTINGKTYGITEPNVVNVEELTRSNNNE